MFAMTENDRKWTPNQVKFIEWLSYGKFERIPATQSAFAKEIGVGEKTLWRWKQLPGFWDEVKRRVRTRLDEHYADIYGALTSEAKRGSFQHINKYLELMGDAAPQGSEVNPFHQKIVIEYADD